MDVSLLPNGLRKYKLQLNKTDYKLIVVSFLILHKFCYEVYKRMLKKFKNTKDISVFNLL